MTDEVRARLNREARSLVRDVRAHEMSPLGHVSLDRRRLWESQLCDVVDRLLPEDAKVREAAIEAALNAWHNQRNVKWLPHERERMARVFDALGIFQVHK